MPEDILHNLQEENRRRWARLLAKYNPITGEGIADFTGQKRVLLRIPDYAVPEQWVPEEMMNLPLIKNIVKAGGIDKFIEKHKWKDDIPTHFEIERRLRRLRNKYDFCAWAFCCIQIKIKGGKGRKARRPFVLNLAQLMVLSLCEQMRKAGEEIDLIILKARQWGGSTFCFFYQTWLLCHWDCYHSFAIVAHEQSASETILTMLKNAMDTYPAWDLGLPDDTKLKLAQVGTTGHAFAIKDSNNNQVLPGMIFLGTAQNPDSCRSKDISGAHYSEVGVWPDTPERRPDDIIADIQGGMIGGELNMQVFESTAKSADDFFHDQWMQAFDKVGEGGLVRLFIPFYYIKWDVRPLKGETEEEFIKWLWEHRNDNTPNGKWRDSGRYYWWLWTLGATFEAINWYRYRRLRMSFSKVCNESPATAEQAFITAGQLVFDPFEVAAIANECTDPVMVGDLISAAHEGEDVLKDIEFVPNSGGNLRIWEEPDDSPISDRYVVAVDIGGPNETSDFSSIRVLDRLFQMQEFGLDARPNIVAEMHYHVDHDRLAYDAVRLAEWYGHAKLVIESNTLETKDKNRDTGGDGFEYILDIIARIYDNLYRRHAPEDKVTDTPTGYYGFHTNTSTKPKIIDHLKTCVRDKLWGEPSKLCTNELAIYIEDHGKYTAPGRKHDDVLMATAILLWIAFKEMPMPQWIKRTTTSKQRTSSNDNLAAL